MQDVLMKNFESFYPDLSRRAIDIRDSGKMELVVRLDDGSTVVYDHLDNTIRTVRKKSNELTDDEYREEIGKRIDRAMRARGYSQIRLSVDTGIPQETINRYVNGRINPGFRNLDKIARVLNCSIEEFRYLE